MLKIVLIISYTALITVAMADIQTRPSKSEWTEKGEEFREMIIQLNKQKKSTVDSEISPYDFIADMLESKMKLSSPKNFQKIVYVLY